MKSNVQTSHKVQTSKFNVLSNLWLSLMRLYMSQRDEYCTQHGEYQCLNVAYQYFEEHHEDTHRNTYCCHTRTCHIVGDSILTDVEHDENDSRKRKCDGV